MIYSGYKNVKTTDLSAVKPLKAGSQINEILIKMMKK